MANSVDPDQTAPIGAVCSGPTLFASVLYLSVMLSNYLQQTTSTDDIFRCIFFGALMANAYFKRLRRKLRNCFFLQAIVSCQLLRQPVDGVCVTYSLCTSCYTPHS